MFHSTAEGKENVDVRRRKYVEDDTQNLIETSKSHEKKVNRKTIALVFVSLLLDLLAFTMILPLLPSLMEYYAKEGGDTGLYATLLSWVREFQRITGTPDRFASVLFGGVLGSMFSFLQFLASPIMGSLSDAYGRKPTLLVCLTGIAVSHALWGFARTFPVFVLARFIGGLSKGNVSLSMAVVTDVSDDNSRAKGMALVGLAFSMGFIIGPMAGAWFARVSATLPSGSWGERPAFYSLGLAIANIALVLFCLPETLPKEKRAKLSFTFSKALDYISPLQLLKFSPVKDMGVGEREKLSSLGFIYFFYLFIYSGLEFTLTFLTHNTFGYTAMQQGKMFLVIGLIMAVLQGGAARRLGAGGARVASRAALWLTAPSFASVAMAAAYANIVWLWIGLVLFAISTAFAVSCLTSLAGGTAPAHGRGLVLGCLRSLGALARAAGPLGASALYWCSGPATTYAIGAVILIVPAVMLSRLKI